MDAYMFAFSRRIMGKKLRDPQLFCCLTDHLSQSTASPPNTST